MVSNSLLKGSRIVFKRDKSLLHNFDLDRIYVLEDVKIVSRETVLPLDFIDCGYVLAQYKPYLIKGLHTTNHDLMGSDCFVTVCGEKISSALVRLATAQDVNQHAKAIL